MHTDCKPYHWYGSIQWHDNTKHQPIQLMTCCNSKRTYVRKLTDYCANYWTCCNLFTYIKADKHMVVHVWRSTGKASNNADRESKLRTKQPGSDAINSLILTLPSAASWKTVFLNTFWCILPQILLSCERCEYDHSTSEICPLNDAGNFSVFGLWRLLDWDPLMASCKRSGVFRRTLILWTCYKQVLIFTHCY